MVGLDRLVASPGCRVPLSDRVLEDPEMLAPIAAAPNGLKSERLRTRAPTWSGSICRGGDLETPRDQVSDPESPW